MRIKAGHTNKTRNAPTEKEKKDAFDKAWEKTFGDKPKKKKVENEKQFQGKAEMG